MITAIVLFDLPPGMTRTKLVEAYRETAWQWRANPYLVRKAYLFDAQRREAGGVYVWRDRAAAEHCLDDAFRSRLADRFGSTPRIAMFDTPMVVDNMLGQVVEPEPDLTLTR